MLKITSKISAVIFIFVAPLLVVIRRYSAEQVTRVESQLGIVPLLFIITISLVALWFFSNQFLEMVRQSKFGYLSITFFGGMLSVLLFLVWFVLQYIVTSAKANLDVFVDNFTYHQNTLLEILVFIVIGISIAFIGSIHSK